MFMRLRYTGTRTWLLKCVFCSTTPTTPVNYQRANTALYQYEIKNGTDPDLKAFALETLPKIQPQPVYFKVSIMSGEHLCDFAKPALDLPTAEAPDSDNPRCSGKRKS
jgi:hypothetical protein